MAKGKKRSRRVARVDTPTHTIHEDGVTVTRHHEDGDSVQVFSTPEAAKEYAKSIGA